jgi:hypothetical protein
MTARLSPGRGDPPHLASGIRGGKRAHESSGRSVKDGWRIWAAMRKTFRTVGHTHDGGM